MLNGLEPIIIFSFFKNIPASNDLTAQINAISKIQNKLSFSEGSQVAFPPIPIYLSEQLTGLFIDSETKSIDVETSTETLNSGSDPVVSQKGINSTIKVSLQANRDSIGMTLLAALLDLAFTKVTSKEYSITYLHGAVTVFGGLLHSFSITQNADNDLYTIEVEITRGGVTQDKAAPPLVPKTPGVSL